MKERERGGNEKIKGGEMEKKKERGKLETINHVYLCTRLIGRVY
jgi:hypothetical protein